MVLHATAISKWEKCGLDRITVKWRLNLLNNHKQRVALNGSMSNWQEISSRIPERHLMGPVLFVVFKNDLVVGTESCRIRFANWQSFQIPWIIE